MILSWEKAPWIPGEQNAYYDSHYYYHYYCHHQLLTTNLQWLTSTRLLQLFLRTTIYELQTTNYKLVVVVVVVVEVVVVVLILVTSSTTSTTVVLGVFTTATLRSVQAVVITDIWKLLLVLLLARWLTGCVEENGENVFPILLFAWRCLPLHNQIITVAAVIVVDGSTRRRTHTVASLVLLSSSHKNRYKPIRDNTGEFDRYVLRCVGVLLFPLRLVLLHLRDAWLPLWACVSEYVKG